MANRIHRKGPFVKEEAVAGAASILPGMLVKLNSLGKVVVHADEGGYAEGAIVEEDALQGVNVTTAYTSGDVLSYILPGKGAEANVLIEDGQDIAIGDQLISAANGKFKEGSDLESGETLDQVIAIAVEACDLTGSNTSDTLCGARFI